MYTGLFYVLPDLFLTIVCNYPEVHQRFPSGLYLTASPVITANWEAEDDKWTVPIGGGLGKIVRLGKLPVNIAGQAFYNVEGPDATGDWSLRLQFTFLFPK